MRVCMYVFIIHDGYKYSRCLVSSCMISVTWKTGLKVLKCQHCTTPFADSSRSWRFDLGNFSITDVAANCFKELSMSLQFRVYSKCVLISIIYMPSLFVSCWRGCVTASIGFPEQFFFWPLTCHWVKYQTWVQWKLLAANIFQQKCIPTDEWPPFSKQNGTALERHGEFKGTVPPPQCHVSPKK